jgi:hypothetical protein
MTDFSYHLPAFGTILSHFPLRPPVVRDGFSGRAKGDADSFEPVEDDISELLTRARIKSGDYFATLATELDKMAQGLNTVRAPEASELERIVGELLYLDDNYRLVKK